MHAHMFLEVMDQKLDKLYVQPPRDKRLLQWYTNGEFLTLGSA